MNIKVYYRISDAGYSKVKPQFVNNQNCLTNFYSVFHINKNDINIFADNTSPETDELIQKISKKAPIKTSFGSSGQSFRNVYEKAISENTDDTIIYFVENDYIHNWGSMNAIIEGIEMGADYVTLYDHPDKYIDKDKGGNPEVENGGEITQVFLTNNYHWKLTNSTTMTFAATVKTLIRDAYVIKKHTSGSYPTDYQMCVELRALGKTMISPIPGLATHGETMWLSPLIDWQEVMNNSISKFSC